MDEPQRKDWVKVLRSEYEELTARLQEQGEPEDLARNLVGAAEIAGRAGVGTRAVSMWRARHETFPTPIDLKMGPVYWWPSVERWLKETGRLT